MNDQRYERMGYLLSTIQRLTEAREILWLASISCQFHGLKTEPGGLAYAYVVTDQLNGLDHVIKSMREDIDRQCGYEEDELENAAGTDLSVFPGPGKPA